MSGPEKNDETVFYDHIRTSLAKGSTYEKSASEGLLLKCTNLYIS